MNTRITIRLDAPLAQALRGDSRRTGQSRAAILRDAIRRYLALRESGTLRKQMIRFAEAAGYFTDEDVYQDVS